MVVFGEASAAQGDRTRSRHGWWWKTLIGGAALWVLTIIVTGATGNTNLVPTLILLGSFLVPFCVVLFALERVPASVGTMRLVMAFFVGGIIGVLGASVLETSLRPSAGMYVGVGFIEELAKGVVLVIVSWSVPRRSRVEGALIGAVVGAGFAAFESAGYAFNAAITMQGVDLISLLQTEVVRALLAPLGHVLWTAVLGAVLFGLVSARTKAAAAMRLLVAYVAVALLHALWDSLGGITSFLALVFTGSALQQLQYGFLQPSTAEAVSSLATALYVVGVLLTSVIGALLLIRAVRGPRPDPMAAFPERIGFGEP